MTAPGSERWRVDVGDCREVLAAMPAGSVDAVVCDPPYGLSFMGKEWDHAVPGAEFWREALRVAKPGAHLAAFGGTRLYHRLTCAIEDAGWQVRDCLSWLYGSGFPKSLDVGKAIDRQRHDREQVYRVTAWVRAARDAAGITNADIDAAFGFNGMAGHWTSAKSQPSVPTLEQVPALLALLGSPEVPAEVAELLIDLNGRKGQPGEAWFRREVVGTARNQMSGWDVDGGTTYVDRDISLPATDAAKRWDGWGTALKPAWEPIVLARKPLAGTVAANVQAHGCGGLNIDGCRIDAEGRWPANVAIDAETGAMLDESAEERPARFFYCPKAETSDRDEGLEGFAAVPMTDVTGRAEGSVGAKASGFGGTTETPKRNTHPTVKPTGLMRWLCRLVTPPGGVVLDPFTGSGSTGKAALLEGFRFVGAELDEGYAAVARARCAHADAAARDAVALFADAEPTPPDDLGLFAGRAAS